MAATGQCCSLKPSWFCLMTWLTSVYGKGHEFVLCGIFRGKAEGRPTPSSTGNALAPSEIIKLKLVRCGVGSAAPQNNPCSLFPLRACAILLQGSGGSCLGSVLSCHPSEPCQPQSISSLQLASARHSPQPSPAQALKFLHKSFRLSLFLLGTMPPVGSVNTER